jgi:hypothetical protein
MTPALVKRLISLVSSLASKATLTAVCGNGKEDAANTAAAKKLKKKLALEAKGKGGASALAVVCPKWAMTQAQALAEALCPILPAPSVLDLLSIFRERSAKWTPTPAMFGVVTTAAVKEGGGDDEDEDEEAEEARGLLVSLIPHTRIAHHLAAWANVLWAPSEKALLFLSQRRLDAHEVMPAAAAWLLLLLLFAAALLLFAARWQQMCQGGRGSRCLEGLIFCRTFSFLSPLRVFFLPETH